MPLVSFNASMAVGVNLAIIRLLCFPCFRCFRRRRIIAPICFFTSFAFLLFILWPSEQSTRVDYNVDVQDKTTTSKVIASTSIKMSNIKNAAVLANDPEPLVVYHDNDQKPAKKTVIGFPKPGELKEQTHLKNSVTVTEKLGDVKNIAVVVYGEYSVRFVKDAKKSFNLTVPKDKKNNVENDLSRDLNVTYFTLMKGKGIDEPNVKLVPLGENEEINQANSCKIIEDYSHKFGYFDESHFSHVLIFDSFLSIPGNIKVNVMSTFIDKLVAIKHPIYDRIQRDLLPFDRNSSSCSYVSSPDIANNRQAVYFFPNFFGGSTKEIRDMCHEIAKCDSPNVEFHQKVNFYFFHHLPTKQLESISVVLKGGTEAGPRFRGMSGLQIQYDESKFAKKFDNPNFDDLDSFNERSKMAQNIAERMKLNYFSGLRTTDNLGKSKFITHLCEENCEEDFGAQSRSSAALLIFSMATSRYFVNQWPQIDFLTNHAWYEVSETVFSRGFSIASYKPRYAFVDSSNVRTSNTLWAIPLTLQERRKRKRQYTDENVLFVITKQCRNLLDTIFRSGNSVRNLLSAIPNSLPEYPINTDQSLFLSAAMRVLFDEKNAKIQIKTRIQNFINKIDEWSGSVKIGIHVGSGVNYQCFVDKAKEVVEKYPGSKEKKFKIFISVNGSNPSEARTKLQFQLGTKNVEFHDENMATIDDCSTCRWILLTKMDVLLITQESFGESASLFSLQPTQRLEQGNRDRIQRCNFQWFNNDIIHQLAE